jgi:hypothetical protein
MPGTVGASPPPTCLAALTEEGLFKARLFTHSSRYRNDLVEALERRNMLSVDALDLATFDPQSNVPITATFTHWDLTQPGGFSIG